MNMTEPRDWAPGEENAFQSALEDIAYDAYHKRSPEFCCYLHETWIPENPDALTALVCLASGGPTARIAAAAIADQIREAFEQHAYDQDWCRSKAMRRIE